MKAIKNLNNLSENSKKSYLFYLAKINNGQLPKNASIYFNIEDIKEKIKDYKPASKLLIINAIMTILSKYKSFNYMKYYNTYKRYRDDVLIKEQINYQGGKRYPSDDTNQTNGMIDETNHQKSSTEEKQPLIDNIKNPLNRFIYSLYSLQTPRRAMDYYAMDIVKNKSEVPEHPVLNYLCEDDKCFIFAKYKTSAIYKIQQIPISDELWSEYERYKPTRSEKNNRLIQKENGDPVDNNQFISYRLNCVLGKGKSVNYLRHKFVRDNLINQHNKIEEEAEKMGHSFSANNYYKKYV